MVLNIDNDHLDYYGSMGELKFAFKRFALMTQFMIFANADDKNTMDVMYTLDRRVRTFAIDNHGDYRAVNINEYKPGFFEFDLKEWNTTDTTRIRLSVPGRHNIYNALAMCAVCRFVGLSAEQCAEAALNFKGAGRRFEVYGECNGALVIDDYAHHPTELRATLNTAKEMGYKRLIAVHQPFTYSRTKMLFNDFVDVLKIPDITVLTPSWQPRAQRSHHYQRKAGSADPRLRAGEQPAGSRRLGKAERPARRSGHHPRLRRYL